MDTTLRAFAIAAAYGLALTGGAAALRPSAAVAASDLFALTLQSAGGTFGSVDLATGTFTPFGPGPGLGSGYYAPIFDPAANAFFATSVPLGTPSFSNTIVRIDATTGAATDLVLKNPSNPIDSPFVEGLGVVSSPLAAVPELSTWTMMVVGFAGLGFVASRRWPERAKS
jgi:hypothetical protein